MLVKRRYCLAQRRIIFQAKPYGWSNSGCLLTWVSDCGYVATVVDDWEDGIKLLDLEDCAWCYIGRSVDNDIQIADKFVSRRDLKMRRKVGNYAFSKLYLCS
jgi:hypothetical protein